MPSLHDFLRDYGYLTLFLVVLVESFGIPAPGQTLLIATAVLAAQGKLNIAVVLATAFLGTALGGCVGYGIGQRGGRGLILRFGRYAHVGEPELHRLEGSFNRYGIWFVMFARFFEVLRQLNAIVAGTADMSFRRFLVANLVGSALWVSVWGIGSWRLGHHIQDYESLIEETGNAFIIVAIASLLVLLAVFAFYRWKKRSKPPG